MSVGKGIRLNLRLIVVPQVLFICWVAKSVVYSM